MKKYLLLMTILLPQIASASNIEYVDQVKINEISVYDDYEDGLIYLGMSKTHPSCSNGAYLKRNSIGFKELYSLVLTAATTRQELKFQIYIDRIKSGRCEVDAIRAFYN